MVVWHVPRLWETQAQFLIFKQSGTFILISHILGRSVPTIIWPCLYLLSYFIFKTKLIFILLPTLRTCDYLLAHVN